MGLFTSIGFLEVLILDMEQEENVEEWVWAAAKEHILFFFKKKDNDITITLLLVLDRTVISLNQWLVANFWNLKSYLFIR